MSHRKCTTDGILRQLVPDGTDTGMCHLPIVEIGMRQVEADIHQSHHDTLTCIGLMNGCGFIDRQGIDDDSGRIEQLVCRGVGFDTFHLSLSRQSR